MIQYKVYFHKHKTKHFYRFKELNHFKNSIKVLKISASPMKVFPTEIVCKEGYKKAGKKLYCRLILKTLIRFKTTR